MKSEEKKSTLHWQVDSLNESIIRAHLKGPVVDKDIDLEYLEKQEVLDFTDFPVPMLAEQQQQAKNQRAGAAYEFALQQAV